MGDACAEELPVGLPSSETGNSGIPPSNRRKKRGRYGD